jgi:hypothetical protein
MAESEPGWDIFQPFLRIGAHDNDPIISISKSGGGICILHHHPAGGASDRLERYHDCGMQNAVILFTDGAGFIKVGQFLNSSAVFVVNKRTNKIFIPITSLAAFRSKSSSYHNG